MLYKKKNTVAMISLTYNTTVKMNFLLINKKKITKLVKAYQNSWTLDARVGRWTLDVGLWTLDIGLWTLDSGCWIVDIGLWTLDSEPWTMNSRRWTPDIGLWTVDVKPLKFKTVQSFSNGSI